MVGLNEAFATKYRTMQQNADTNRFTAEADADYKDRMAGIEAANAASLAGLRQSQSRRSDGLLTGEIEKNQLANEAASLGLTQAKNLNPLFERGLRGLGALSDAELGSGLMLGRNITQEPRKLAQSALKLTYDTNTGQTSMRPSIVPPINQAQLSEFNTWQAKNKPAGASVVTPVSTTDAEWNSLASGSSADTSGYSSVLEQFKRDNPSWKPSYFGENRVPGPEGEGDTRPYMLSPGEAVLNREAVSALGRDKVAKLNAEGRKKLGLRRDAPEVIDGVSYAEGGAEVPLNKRAYQTMADGLSKGVDATKGLVKQYGTKALGGLATLAAPVVTALEAHTNLDKNRDFYNDPTVGTWDKMRQSARDTLQPAMTNALALGGGFVGSGASPVLGTALGATAGTALGKGIDYIVDDEGAALQNYRKVHPKNNPAMSAAAAEAAQAEKETSRKAFGGFKEAVNAKQQKLDDYSATYDAQQKEAGLRGALALLSMAQMGGNQQAGYVLKNMMDADANVAAAAAKAKADKNNGANDLSVGDSVKRLESMYGEGMVQPIMQGAEQLRTIDIESLRAKGDVAGAEALAQSRLPPEYYNRAAMALSLKNGLDTRAEKAATYGGGGGLAGLIAGGLAGAKLGSSKGKMVGGVRGAVGGGLLGGLVGGATGFFSGGEAAPKSLGLDPYRRARIVGDQVVLFDESGGVQGQMPLSDVPESVLPQLYAQSR